MKMKLLVVSNVLILIAWTEAGPSMHNPLFCYATDPIRSVTAMHGIATSYEAIRRFNVTTVNPYTNPDNCTASKFWFLSTFGTWLPGAGTMERMIEIVESSVPEDIVRNYEEGRTTLCKEDYENIRDFSVESEFDGLFTIENAGMPMEAGRIAMRNISRCFQQAYPDILTEPYTPARYHFRHINDSRSNATIRAFAAGLFGEAGAENVIYEPLPEVDWLLRPLEFCPLFNEESADYNRERWAFGDGPEMQEMIQQVNEKLGFRGSNRLTLNQTVDLWLWCRFKVGTTFETSNSETGANSTWCAPFSVANQLVLEYWLELVFYYRNGHGLRNQRLLQNLNCGVLQDLLRHMQSESGFDGAARIFVGDVSSIHILLVALGSYRDVWPLHRHNFAQQLDRRWRESLITPFNANLAVIRFDCDDGDHDLIFLHNEKPLLIPGCNQENGVCKLSDVVSRFQRFVYANCENLFCSSD